MVSSALAVIIIFIHFSYLSALSMTISPFPPSLLLLYAFSFLLSFLPSLLPSSAFFLSFLLSFFLSFFLPSSPTSFLGFLPSFLPSVFYFPWIPSFLGFFFFLVSFFLRLLAFIRSLPFYSDNRGLFFVGFYIFNFLLWTT